MSAHGRPRAPLLSAALALAAGLVLFFTWSLFGETLAEVLLAAVVGGALVVLYRLRRYARERLIYSPATRDPAPASGADADHEDGSVTVPAAIAPTAGEAPVKDMAHPSAASGYRRMRTQLEADATSLRASLDSGTGAAVRHAYRTLDRRLGQAVAFVERLVPAAHRTHHPPAPLHADRRQARLWHLELRRLRDTRERLRFLALDEPRVRTPDTVRVATRAATGPPVHGLRVGEHAAALPSGNGTGIELPETLDRISCWSSATSRAVVGRSQPMSGGPSRRTLTSSRSAPRASGRKHVRPD